MATAIISSILKLCRGQFPAIRFFRRRTPQLGRLGLPPELLLLIVSHLDRASTVSLSLTCRALFRICSISAEPRMDATSIAMVPMSMPMDAADKEALLLLLERDLPSYYFCHYCVKLHRWWASWFRDHPGYMIDDIDRGMDCKSDSWHVLSYWLPYHIARVVMNRHFYGIAHGVQVKKLYYSIKWDDFYDYNTRSRSAWRARIVDEQLILSGRPVFRNLSGSGRRLRKLIDSPYELEFCPHTSTSVEAMSGLWWQRPSPDRVLPELARPDPCANASASFAASPRDHPDNYFTPCQQSVRSCRICLTDFCTSIHWDGSRRGWTIEVVVYKLCGSLRSPSDWK